MTRKEKAKSILTLVKWCQAEKLSDADTLKAIKWRLKRLKK